MPSSRATSAVVPAPMNGSRTIPFSGQPASIQVRIRSGGKVAKCAPLNARDGNQRITFSLQLSAVFGHPFLTERSVKMFVFYMCLLAVKINIQMQMGGRNLKIFRKVLNKLSISISFPSVKKWKANEKAALKGHNYITVLSDEQTGITIRKKMLSLQKINIEYG